MATILQGPADESVLALKAALDGYEAQHQGAQADLYRQNAGSIRVRVIDSRFQGMPKARRHGDVWQFLSAQVPEDTLSDVSVLLLIAPAERGTSLMNLEFENPMASSL